MSRGPVVGVEASRYTFWAVFSLLVLSVLWWYALWAKWATAGDLAAWGTVGVTFVAATVAAYQLWLTRRIAQMQFEDALNKEFRDLNLFAYLIWENIDAAELNKLIYRYFDLTNEQINLHLNQRISRETWENWAAGIKYVMGQEKVKSTWEGLKARNLGIFEELIAFERLLFDPAITKADL